MTNYEFYKNDDEFNKICMCGRFAVDVHTGCITPCSKLECEHCLFSNAEGTCAETRLNWLDSEYVNPKEEKEIDWSKVKVDTPVLVRDATDERWYRRYFAKYKDGTVFCFADGMTSWSYDEEADELIGWRIAKLWEQEN